MPVQTFSFPIPETRFFHVGQHVYKFKIRRGSRFSGEEELLDSEFVSEELENAVRVVLMNLDNLQPFATQHFNIFPYKSRWERVSELRFRKGDKKLIAYPFLITLYVETNEPPLRVNHANKLVPSYRECTLDSPQLPTSHAFPSDNEPKCMRTEEPQEGPLRIALNDDEADIHMCLHDVPHMSEGAGETVCGNEVYGDSEESSSDATSSECHVEQNATDFTSKEGEKPGVLARLASIAVFPFSLLFRRS